MSRKEYDNKNKELRVYAVSSIDETEGSLNVKINLKPGSKVKVISCFK